MNKQKNIILGLAICFTIFLGNQNAFSYHTLNKVVMNTFVFDRLPSMPVDFVIDMRPPGEENGLTLAQAACDEWDAIPNIDDFCGTLTQSNTDITLANVGAETGTADDINNIVFDEDGSILDNFGFTGALGVGLTVTDDSGNISDILIIINGSFSNSFSSDFLATLIHEMGHTWGLAHTPIGGVSTFDLTPDGLDPIDPIATPTMSPFTVPFNAQFGRTLETDDIASALLLYGP